MPPINAPKAPRALNEPQGVGNSQFDILRKRARQRATRETQGVQDALKRRFASIGQLGSGAFIKQQRIAGDEAGRRVQEAEQGIDVAEAQENQRRKELLEGREFQTSERVGSQNFAGKQARLGETFQRRFLTRQQRFAGSEAQKQRDFQSALADREFQAQMKQNFLTNQINLANLGNSLGFNITDPSGRDALIRTLQNSIPAFNGIAFDADGDPILT